MPTFDELSSDSNVSIEEASSSDVDQESLAATLETAESERGLSDGEKRIFLRDIDRAGGFENVVLSRIFSANPKVYGIDDKARQKKFRNLFDYWRHRHTVEGKFQPIRSKLFPEHPPRNTATLSTKKSRASSSKSSREGLSLKSPSLSSSKKKRTDKKTSKRMSDLDEEAREILGFDYESDEEDDDCKFI